MPAHYIHFAYFLHVSNDMGRECRRKSCEWNVWKRNSHLTNLSELLAECPSSNSMCFICSNQCELFHENTFQILLGYRQEMAIFLQENLRSHVYNSII